MDVGVERPRPGKANHGLRMDGGRDASAAFALRPAAYIAASAALLFSGLFTGPASAQTVVAYATAAAPESPPGMEFFTYFPGSNGVIPLNQGAWLPYVVQQTCIGWTYRFGSASGQSVPEALDERLILPAATPNWGDNPDTIVAPDRKSALTRVPVAGRQASNEWCSAEGDPSGQYRIEVRRGGKLLGQRSFMVEKVTRRAE
jgi:hypothetical protein